MHNARRRSGGRQRKKTQLDRHTVVNLNPKPTFYLWSQAKEAEEAEQAGRLQMEEERHQALRCQCITQRLVLASSSHL